MATFPIELPPGVERSATADQSSGRYYDTNLVRWRQRALEPVGGWRQKGTDSAGAGARAIKIWSDNSGQAWIAIGTYRKLLAMDRAGELSDITPIRATTTPTDPFDTTDTSTTVLVTDTAHGATAGVDVIISGASAVGGITIDGTYTVLTVPTANTYTIAHTSPASATANGGGSVTIKYQMNPGRLDSDFRGGYGNGNYGVGTYGTPRGDNANPNDVSVWSLDTFGEDLVGVMADDGIICEWGLDVSAPAEAVTGAPTARALVVTAERILMALGADGNPREVDWSNQEDDTDWTPSTTNYAGDFILQTPGKLMCGRRVRGGTLLLTDVDAHLAEFIGQPLVYGFRQVGAAGTGIVAQGAIATIDGDSSPISAIWMGPQGFMGYNGAVQSIPCPVAPYVFDDINRTQITKVTASHNADFGEVIFYYPSGSSTENDRAVRYNYREDWWSIDHDGIRLCGSEKGPLAHPLAVDSTGRILEHEVGLDHEDADWYAETGPFLIGEGDRNIQVLKVYPDERTLGDSDVTFLTRFRPNGDESEFGPYSLSEETDVRFTAREVRVRITGTRLAAAAVGRFKLEGRESSRR